MTDARESPFNDLVKVKMFDPYNFKIETKPSKEILDLESSVAGTDKALKIID